jgi:hypothetical protein
MIVLWSIVFCKQAYKMAMATLQQGSMSIFVERIACSGAPTIGSGERGRGSVGLEMADTGSVSLDRGCCAGCGESFG